MTTRNHIVARVMYYTLLARELEARLRGDTASAEDLGAVAEHVRDNLPNRYDTRVDTAAQAAGLA